jgi:hypothetical protein
VSLPLTRKETRELENALVSLKLEEERTLQGVDPHDTEFKVQLQQHLVALDA